MRGAGSFSRTAPPEVWIVLSPDDPQIGLLAKDECERSCYNACMLMMPNLELPAPTVEVSGMAPRALVAHNQLLGRFASSPRCLAPHLALAATELSAPRSAEDIASELIEAATPTVTFDADDRKHLVYRLGILFGPDGVYAKGEGEVGGLLRGIMHNEPGREAVPAVALLAARWLTDREVTHRLMPASPTCPRQHGTRLAILQHCLPRATRPARIAANLRMATSTVKGMAEGFRLEGILTREGSRRDTSYMVTPDLQSAVGNLLAQVHSLKDPAYADTLRTDVVTAIVKTPHWYGPLAYAALTDIAATRRVSKSPSARLH